MAHDGGKSLLDMLNQPAGQDKHTRTPVMSDRADLLSLLSHSQQAKSTPASPSLPITPSASSVKKSANANDLLAALIGSTSPKPPQNAAASSRKEQEESANLLTALLGASKSPLPRAEQRSPQPNYLNPNHQLVNPKPTIFSNANGFDELDVMTKRSASISTIPAPQRTASDSVATTQRRQSEPKAPAESSLPSEISEEVNLNAYRIPQDVSSVIKIPETLGSIPVSTDTLTKISIKHDPINRNIIAASTRYFAYPVNKEGFSASIRIVDQDSGTAHLVEHCSSSRIINLNFAKLDDIDGHNVLMTTDADSTVGLWSIAPSIKTAKLFEIAGPSDGSHKSRARWSTSGKFFGVALTSRIYVFELANVQGQAKQIKVKLHPEMKQCFCVLKTEKALKDFAFSPDDTSLVGVDKLCNLRMWILQSGGTTVSPGATLSLGERALLGVEFVSSRHVVAGTQFNDSVVLVDLKAAKNVQELKLPKANPKTTYAMSSRLMYMSDTLFVNNEFRQSIYAIHLDLPVSQDSTKSIIQSLSLQNTHLEGTGKFTAFTEFIAELDSKHLLGYTVAKAQDMDIFFAHERGYSLYSISQARLNETFNNGQMLDRSCLSKLQHMGRLISEVPEEPTEVKKPRAPSPDPDAAYSRYKKPPPAKQTRSKDEEDIRSILTSELQRSDHANQLRIEALQKTNDVRHEAVLRLVSETLSKNTANVLKSTVAAVMDQAVLPKLKEQLDERISAQLKISLSAVPGMVADKVQIATRSAVDAALKDSGLLDSSNAALRDMTERHIHMEQSIAGALLRLDAQILERQKVDSGKIDSLQATIDALRQQLQTIEARLQASSSIPLAIAQPISQNMPHAPSPFQSLPARPLPLEDLKKYFELIMEFVSKTQKIATGDKDAVPFVRQFLAWQPTQGTKEHIAQALSEDQLQLLAFVHALASRLNDDDAFNRVHWISTALPYLAVQRDSRLQTLGPRLLEIIRENLTVSLEQAPPSPYRQLLEATLTSFSAHRHI